MRALRTPGKDYSIILEFIRQKERLRGRIRGLLGIEKTLHIHQRTEEYRRIWESAARQLGAELAPISDGLWEIRLGARKTRLSGFLTQFDDPVTLQIAGDKLLTLRLAERQAVPVPTHKCFTLATLNEAESFLRLNAIPCVVKPMLNTGGSVGVTSYVSTRRDLRVAAIYASLFSEQILIEKLIPGEAIRLLYLNGRMIHAVRRSGISVLGDGVSDLTALMARSAQAAVAGDKVVSATLIAQGLTASYVPTKGERVLVRNLPQSEQGGREMPTQYSEDVTNLIGGSLAEELGRIVNEVGSNYAGVDIITLNPRTTLRESKGAFIELNTTPGIHQHCLARTGEKDCAAAVEVLKALLDVPV